MPAKNTNIHVNMMEMFMSLATAIDLVDQELSSHHKTVAYLSYRIASACGLDKDEINEIFMAGLIHDIGSIALSDHVNILDFETHNGFEHAELGHMLLGTFAQFDKLADIVRHHHVLWSHGEGVLARGDTVPIGSHIIHLADNICSLLNPDKHILGQVQSIADTVSAKSGDQFAPECVDAFMKISANEALWLDLSPRNIDKALISLPALHSLSLELGDLLSFSKLFSRIIDSRSNFTATHSSGVAASAAALARLSGFSYEDQVLIEVAGYLHDIGKLVVPTKIIEKPKKLSDEEWNIMQSHAYYTYSVLDPIPGMIKIKVWAASHHERLDGSGYPFHHKGDEMTLGARILAVADIFTALSEDRPYRRGMGKTDILNILAEMVADGAIDGSVVQRLVQNYDIVDTNRAAIQEQSLQANSWFWEQKGILDLELAN